MIQFIDLHIKNFLSHKDTKLPLVDRGVVLVLGKNEASGSLDSNGAGKTTIAEAIYWCIYGKTFRDIPAAAVVNLSSGKDCVVTLILEKNGQQYTLCRSRKSAAESNKLLVTTPTGNVTGLDAQKVIGDLLDDMDSDQLASMAFFGKGYKTKLFHEMSDGEKKALFENVCKELSTLTKMNKTNRENLAEIKANTQKTTYLEQNLCNLLLSAQRNLDEEVARRDNIISTAKARIFACKEIIRDFNDRIETLGKGVVEKPEKTYQDEELVYKDKIRRYQTDYNSCTSTIHYHQTSIRAAKTEKICPTCKRPWDTGTACVDVADLENQIAVAQATKEKTSKLVAKYEEQLAALRATFETNYQKYMDYKYKSESLARDKQREIEKLDFIRKEAENGADDSRIIKLEEEVSSLTAQHNSALRTIKRLAREEDTKNCLATVVSDNGLKSYLLDDLLAKIEEHAGRMSKYLSGGELEIQLTAAGSDFRKRDGNIIIKAFNNNGSDVYSGNSSGEKTRVDLCIIFALILALHDMYGVDIKFLFLDEVLDSLDDTGVEAVIELLDKEILPVKSTVFVTSHNDTLKNSFSDVITIVKDKR